MDYKSEKDKEKETKSLHENLNKMLRWSVTQSNAVTGKIKNISHAKLIKQM